jgi:UDP-glucose 4-epimerase
MDIQSEFLHGAKVLVTGGAGFIGSHIVDRVVELGGTALILDNMSTGRRENLNPAARLIEADIRSAEVKNLVLAEKPDYIVHCAAQKSVPKSVKNPYEDADVNIMGFLNLMSDSAEYQPKKTVFISTGGAIYGNAAPIPTPETYVPVIETPYAASKFATEKYLECFSSLFNLQYAVLRLANVYGPRQVPDGECGVVAIFLENILKQKPSILFAYADMPKGTTRDYVYVDDVVDSVLLALQTPGNDTFNISSGKEIHMDDIYAALQRVSGTNYELIRQSERKGDVRRSAIDNTKARDILGWSPKTSFEEGLQLTFAQESQRQR